MRRFLERIFDVSRYTGLVERDRARMVYAISVLAFVGAALFMVITFVAPEAVFGDNVISPSLFTVLFGIFYVGVIGAIAVTRGGKSRLGGFIIVVMVVLSFGPLSIGSGANTFQDGMLFLILLVLSGLLLDEWGLLLGSVIAIGIKTAALVITPSDSTAPLDTWYSMASVVLLVAVSALLIYAFLRFARTNRVEGAAGAEIERMKTAQLTSQITQRISRRLAPSEVMRNTVEEICKTYPNIYHAQIFLTEPNGLARLVASTGEVGKMLIDRQHSLPIGSQSVIGQVTLNNQHVIARSNSNNTVHRRNEFLPDTMVEAAFPMRIGDVVIGALDLQSKISDSFDEGDTPIFQSLADNVAIAIDNARLFEETERRLQENQQLVAQMSQSSEEVKRLNDRLTGRFWKDFLHQQSSPALHLDLNQDLAVVDNTWTPGLKQAITDNQPVQSHEKDGSVVSVPLRVRGQVIGAMEFELDENGTLSSEDLAMMEEVSEQLGMAAEANRLYETSQRIAQREALVNEISTRLQSGSTVEMTLSSAARSLKDVLKANKVSIRLGKPPVETTQGGQA
ncbi:MAG: GAF domain-containing protein [Chloroflexi bacterium]|nr:GAF domain-containing protein [Chloroflexota bacterium]MCC6894794.1 GAF domain-containing protein [Anaerolineae bacterium]